MPRKKIGTVYLPKSKKTPKRDLRIPGSYVDPYKRHIRQLVKDGIKTIGLAGDCGIVINCLNDNTESLDFSKFISIDSNNKITLGVDGKLFSHTTSINITNVEVIGTLIGRDALTPSEGWVAIITSDLNPDNNGSYIYDENTTQRYKIEGIGVDSVNGFTGVINLEALDIPYNNVISGLLSTDIQGAINEVSQQIASSDSSIFEEVDNVIREKSTAYDNDFVVGSPQLDGDYDLRHYSRMFFDKGKSAFRVGRADGGQRDSLMIGLGSNAFSSNSTASGRYSNAFSFNSTASGTCANAFGSSSTASGPYSNAFGSYSTASGSYSTAIGRSMEASGIGSFGIELSGLVENNILTQDNTMAIMSGVVGINVLDATQDLDVLNTIRLRGVATGTDTEVLTVDSTGVVHKQVIPSGGGSGGTVQPTDLNTYNIRATDEGLVVGNARGENSVDLQTIRLEVDMVSSGAFSTISGGQNNEAPADGSSIGGGNFNSTIGRYSTVAGGMGNSAEGSLSSIIGGENNHTRATAAHSSVLGGQENAAKGQWSAVAGFINSSESAFEFTVGCHSKQYTPTSIDSWVATDKLFVVGNGVDILNSSNAVTVLKSGDTSFGNFDPTEKVDIDGTARLRGVATGTDTEMLTVDSTGVVHKQVIPGAGDPVTLNVGVNPALSLSGQEMNLDLSVSGSYDNTTSGLTADNVKGAIDELDSTIDNLPSCAITACIVDASGNGDYLTITEALTGGCSDIFVRKGNYSETTLTIPATLVEYNIELESGTIYSLNSLSISTSIINIFTNGGAKFNFTLSDTNLTAITGGDKTTFTNITFLTEDSSTSFSTFINNEVTFFHGCVFETVTTSTPATPVQYRAMRFNDCTWVGGHIVLGGGYKVGFYSGCTTEGVIGIGFNDGNYSGCFMGDGVTIIYDEDGSTTGRCDYGRVSGSLMCWGVTPTTTPANYVIDNSSSSSFYARGGVLTINASISSCIINSETVELGMLAKISSSQIGGDVTANGDFTLTGSWVGGDITLSTNASVTGCKIDGSLTIDISTSFSRVSSTRVSNGITINGSSCSVIGNRAVVTDNGTGNQVGFNV